MLSFYYAITFSLCMLLGLFLGVVFLKKMGFRIDSFGCGLNPKIYERYYNGTNYIFGVIPLFYLVEPRFVEKNRKKLPNWAKKLLDKEYLFDIIYATIPFIGLYIIASIFWVSLGLSITDLWGYFSKYITLRTTEEDDKNFIEHFNTVINTYNIYVYILLSATLAACYFQFFLMLRGIIYRLADRIDFFNKYRYLLVTAILWFYVTYTTDGFIVATSFLIIKSWLSYIFYLFIAHFTVSIIISCVVEILYRKNLSKNAL
jgi:hypothetical protein